MSVDNEGYIAKMRGLPWSATVDDIVKFFGDCKVLGGKEGVHLTSSREGRPSGEAFVEFEDAEDLNMALQKDRAHIGNRYIEVFKVNRAEMDWVVKRSGASFGSDDDGCVRLRGLPFGCSKEEIAQFFTGLEIVPNGITLLTDYSGRSSGEAYVQFVNREVAEQALQKHREKIGHRYIEIFRSSLSEVNGVLGFAPRTGRAMGPVAPTPTFNNRPSPYDRDRYGGASRFPLRASRSFKGANLSNTTTWTQNGAGGQPRASRSPFDMDSWSGPPAQGGGMHCIHMRGLPFKATQDDIADFFKPVVPVEIHLLPDDNGRASGEADVEFSSHDDAVKAMSKDKGHMQHRYIELFLNSSGGSGGGAFGAPGNRRRF
ncbi:heterogeneous nuclear ribonucleoprotein H-like [Cylas formicarius]|uniref:heterogeneous nuclear ribonucleoprotein H-like n=1 Tax=Cylas formicarius TaxID=197179 RepID=UPI002958959C|nr:heterogeneous nuclear ribonucleoprotein H-like [Cylas formicarius]